MLLVEVVLKVVRVCVSALYTDLPYILYVYKLLNLEKEQIKVKK